MQIRKALAQALVHLEERRKDRQQEPIPSYHLAHPGFEANACDSANLQTKRTQRAADNLLVGSGRPHSSLASRSQGAQPLPGRRLQMHCLEPPCADNLRNPLHVTPVRLHH
ncbi:hypothetical protein NKI41_31165 [Mesorhizobium sp. M0601]|uniref:hypothetical protein n=1 Tax=Mesorhizobium sp. M0601 TaxID=2956969 RepID=UPI003337308F